MMQSVNIEKVVHIDQLNFNYILQKYNQLCYLLQFKNRFILVGTVVVLHLLQYLWHPQPNLDKTTYQNLSVKYPQKISVSRCRRIIIIKKSFVDFIIQGPCTWKIKRAEGLSTCFHIPLGILSSLLPLIITTITILFFSVSAKILVLLPNCISVAIKNSLVFVKPKCFKKT